MPTKKNENGPVDLLGDKPETTQVATSKSDSKKETKEEPFEVTLEKLESIVTRMEDEEMGLEESLKLFKTGVSLVKKGSSRLNEVEKKVEVLLKDAGGEVTAEPYDWEDDKEA